MWVYRFRYRILFNRFLRLVNTDPPLVYKILEPIVP